MQFTTWYLPLCQQFTNHEQKMLHKKHKTRRRNKSLFSDLLDIVDSVEQSKIVLDIE